MPASQVVIGETQRFKALGWITEVEDQRTCCYAVQDKVWLTDPDGNRWELFVVTHYDSDLKNDPEPCCEDKDPDCCNDQTLENASAEKACC